MPARHLSRRLVYVLGALCLASGVEACVTGFPPSGGTTGSSYPNTLSSSGFSARDSWRFAIVSVNDSMVVFPGHDAPWIKPGMQGIAVDPARRDTLVATLFIVGGDTSAYSALITGQLRPVTESHVVLIEHRPPPLYRRGDFLKGAAGGGALVTLLFLIFR